MRRRADRENRILSHLRQTHSAAVSELAAAFSVSDETIRRDLKRLETEGLVEKRHGGVMLSDFAGEPPFRHRMELNHGAKLAIGQRAAEIIPENAVAFVDGGTTCCVAARFLSGVAELTVVTPSIEVARAMTLARRRVLLAPGEIDPGDCCVYGIETAEYLGRFSYGWALFSASAVHASRGCSDFKYEEAMLKRRVAERAERMMILADASKFARGGFAQFCELDAVDILVTNAPPPPEIAERIGGRVEIAPAWSAKTE